MPYDSPGYRIGTGTVPSNTFSPSSAALPPSWGTGTMTPHSQLRQLSFGDLVARSLINLPQALSEQLAEPMYAQGEDADAGEPAVLVYALRTKRICESQSVSSGLG